MLSSLPGSIIVQLCEPLTLYSSLGSSAVNAESALGQPGELAVIRV